MQLRLERRSNQALLPNYTGSGDLDLSITWTRRTPAFVTSAFVYATNMVLYVRGWEPRLGVPGVFFKSEDVLVDLCHGKSVLTWMEYTSLPITFFLSAN
jgi:hypothetical protein